MRIIQEGESVSRDRGARLFTSRREHLILLLIVLIGAALRLYRIDAQSVWYDEAFSVAHSIRPLPELFRVLIYDIVHPPLHYLILHEWFRIAGFGAMQARIVSAIFGTFSIPLLFLLARRFTDSWTSLVAAGLLAISQIAVYFSQEARPYAQAQFLSLLAALTFLSFLQKPNLWRSMSFAAASAALLYTHYYGAGTLLALGLYWLIFRGDYSPLVFRRLATIVVLLAVAYLPWIMALESGTRLSQKRLIQTDRPPSGRSNLFSPIAALNRFNSAKFESIEAPTSVPQALPGLALFTLPAAGALWYASRRGSRGVVLGYLLMAIPLGMAIALGAFGVVFNYRHFSFAVPGYYLAVAIGWRVCFRNRAMRLIWLAAAVGICGLALRANQVVTKPDYRAGFLPLAENYRPGDCVAGRPRMWNNRVHLAWEVYYRNRGVLRLVPFDSLPTVPTGCERLWVVWDRTWWMNFDQEGTKKSQQVIAMLSESYSVVERYYHPAIELQLLERRAVKAAQ